MSEPKGRTKLQLNPAFANAHGLSDAAENADPWAQLDKELVSAESTPAKVASAIVEARRTGKLLLSDVGLKMPLPSSMFDLRNELLLKYDGMMDGNENFWECYGEEMLTLVDLSDNDLSMAKVENEKEQPVHLPSVFDDRIGCYSALQTLRIRNCMLDDLPWNVIGEKCVHLTTMDATGNRFTSVPLNVLPKTVKYLHLTNNKIERLGDGMETSILPEISHLDLAGNELVSLPHKLQTPKLQHLNLTKNKIETISKGLLASCQDTLKTLDLGENQLTLSMNLSQHAELQVLELRLNKLKQVPKIHANLKRLGLSFNDVSSIAGLYPYLENCDEHGKTADGDWFRSNLSDLHLESSGLSDTLHPSTMAVMTNLNFLDVSHNALETIPSVVGYLPRLNKIMLDGNPFRMIRHAITYKANGTVDTAKLLNSLRLKGDPPPGPGYYGSQFETTADKMTAATPQKVIEAKSIVRNALADTNRVLDVSGKGFKDELIWQELVDALLAESDEVGVDATKLSCGAVVSTWKVADGKVTSIGSQWVEAMPCLTSLDARRNCIQALPDNFDQLPLKILELQRNHIESETLRDQVCSNPQSNMVKNLRTLDLSSNALEWIPSTLFDLHSLTFLNLSHNRIKSLNWECDEDTGEGRGWRHGLVALTHLDLSNNRITDLGYLPLALAGCQHLRTLRLNNNCIYNIPLELGLLSQLTSIDLLGNSQRKIRVRVLTQRCQKILEYLKERMTPEELEEAMENHREVREALNQQIDDYGKKVDVDQPSNMRIEETPSTKTTEHPEPIFKENVAEDAMKIINELKSGIDQISRQLENLSITKAKEFALKKELAIKRSHLIREERKLKEN